MPAAAIYVPSMIGLWLFWVVALFTIAGRILKRPPVGAPAVQPPLSRPQPSHAGRQVLDG
jgi:hypothetical protein